MGAIMRIEDYYRGAKEFPSLLLLIEFLVYEKKVHQLTDDASVLNKYFLPKHKERMNGLLLEYHNKRNKKTG